LYLFKSQKDHECNQASIVYEEGAWFFLEVVEDEGT
jgi:hypothetical protein